MSEQQLLFKQAMIVIPLPPAFRVKDEPWQFPTLEVYTESLRLWPKTLPLPLVEDLRLDNGGIRFTVNGEDFWYMAQGHKTKEEASPEITEKLFNLIVVLKEQRYDLVDAAVAELKSTKRSNLLVSAMAVLGSLVFGIVVTFLEEFGCD